MKRLIPTFILLSAVACTPARGPELRQGTGPMAPPFSPTMDAPIRVGQPGTMEPARERLPESPNRRPLPPSAEPGLWAADQPQASKISFGIKFLDNTFPLPPDHTVDEENLAKTCVAMSIQAIGTTIADMGFHTLEDSAKHMSYLTKKEFTCIAARAYAACAEHATLMHHYFFSRGLSNPLGPPAGVVRVSEVAGEFKRKSCRSPISDRAETIAKGIEDYFTKKSPGKVVH